MEKRVKIISQSELRTNNWTNPKGENVVISSVQLEMSDGNDAFVAEVTDQKAIAINNEPRKERRVDIFFKCHKFLAYHHTINSVATIVYG